MTNLPEPGLKGHIGADYVLSKLEGQVDRVLLWIRIRSFHGKVSVIHCNLRICGLHSRTIHSDEYRLIVLAPVETNIKLSSQSSNAHGNVLITI